ncbi:transcription initiation factor TFIID subunit A-domain-containing protein [Irpex lacteus]|nr:transcription initiation factor TFIID subunit A-domain-containing protein [Irpex lacteus]
MSTPTASGSQTPAPSASTAPNGQNNSNIIQALGQVFKAQTGDDLSGERIAQLLLQNMSHLGELAKQGKLNQSQIAQLKEYADRHKASQQQVSTFAWVLVILYQPLPQPTQGPTMLLSSNPTNVNTTYPISETLATPTPDTSASTSTNTASAWPASQQGRPTLTGGNVAGRVAATPAQIPRSSDDSSPYTFEETRTRRKNSPGDQSMRRSIQDLVASIDPNVRIEPEVEDLLLDIADEFIDSVTNFACRLAKHRGGDTLEVRDLQLHLERNHNLRIPGFASDETRISMSQAGITPATQGTSGTKKGAQSNTVTPRSTRLAQVQQAKREAKLL